VSCPRNNLNKKVPSADSKGGIKSAQDNASYFLDTTLGPASLKPKYWTEVMPLCSARELALKYGYYWLFIVIITAIGLSTYIKLDIRVQ